MIALSRNDNSVLSRWWWTVDRWMLLMVVTLIALGLWLAMTASPAVAERIGLEAMHFVKRQALFLGLGLVVVLSISMMSTTMIRRMSVLALPVTLLLVCATLVFGMGNQGCHALVAYRWFWSAAE